MAKKANNPTTFQKLMLFIIAMVGLLPISSHCQGWEVTFGAEKTDEGKAIIQSIDLGYIAVGVSNSFGEDSDQDVYVVRTDVDGTVIWSEIYDDGVFEDALAAIELSDRSIVIAGYIETTIFDNPDVYLLKISKDGDRIWSRTFETPLAQRALDIQPTPDGGFILSGDIAESEETTKTDAFLMKVNADGDQEWMQTYGFEGINDQANAVAVLTDGYAFTGETENQEENTSDDDIITYRVNLEGAIIWERRVASQINDTHQADSAEDLLIAQDGNLIIVGSIYNASQAYVRKIDLNGELIWEQIFGDVLIDRLNDGIILPDGGIAVTGWTDASSSEVNALIARLDADGNLLWSRGLGSDTFFYLGAAIAMTEEGGFVVTGYNGTSLLLFNDLIIIKTDEEGNLNSSRIRGNVFVDSGDELCVFDPGDTFLEGWLITAVSDDFTYFTSTDENGYYEMFVDTGFYELSVLPINDLWVPCIPSYNVQITEFYEIIDDRDFPFFEAASCPFMEVDISTTPLQACEDVTYTIDYCNLGTSSAIGAEVEVFLDDELTYNGNNGPDQTPSVNGNTFTFELGDININECGSFEIYASVTCDDLVDGQSALVSAQIFPDTICDMLDPEWDGSSVAVGGLCEPDSVRFFLNNLGEDMEDSLQYIVIQDDVILFVKKEEGLEADAMLTEGLDNDGSTYRIIAKQADGHPGNSYPTIAVEGCVEDGNGGEYSTGYVTQFPEDDGDASISIDVQEIQVGSDNPALLRGYPKGYGEFNRITANTDITYIINFENIGTDTVNRVVIRDTLSQHLDITTATPGTSSHPYDFKVYDDGILKVTFSDIALLPGGSAEEAQSKGFIKFRIAQKPSLPEETVIENRAAVFFDYHEPVLTNLAKHEVACLDFFESTEILALEACIEVDSSILTSIEPEPTIGTGITIKVQPNPFNESTVIDVTGRDLNELEFSVFDMMGRLISQEKHNTNSFTYYRRNMPAGLYMYKLASEGQLINTGKILIR